MGKKINYPKVLYNTLISHKEPISLVQFITQRCNAKCPHCFVDFKTEKDELNLDEIEKITNSSGKSLQNIAITGGEPFIREDIFEIVNLWYKNSSVRTISITTNGSMPERIKDFANKAAQKEIPVFFFFSYDFIGEKHSDYRKLKNLHINVINSYKIIKSFGNKFRGNFQITAAPDNYETAIETYKYIRDELKIENINIPIIRGEKADNLDEGVRKEIANVYEKLQIMRSNDFDCRKLSGYNDKSITSILLDTKNKILWKYVLRTFLEQRYISPCLSGSLLGIIYYNGDVAPCEILENRMGNLREYDFNFMKLWQSQTAVEIRNEIKSSKCFCTSECSMLVNLFSSPRYYGEILYNLMNNWRVKNVRK